MKELIKITENKGKKTISAKELHDFLGFNPTHWKRWYTKNIEKNPFAIEGVDYIVFAIGAKTSEGGRPTKDFAITIDFAKKISMMAKTAKGEEARNYFLRMEAVAKNIFTPTPTLEDHTKRSIQVKNSKEVNSLQYQLGGVEQIKEYNRKNCKLFTGKLPKEIIEEAKLMKLPSKLRTSAKEVIRNIDPVTACAMSLTDDMVKMGGDHDKAAEISNKHGRAIFQFMISNNMMPGELAR